nr:MAG TPA: hypothetical protein [Caudoviricetes sp.]DAT81779.1 MAG TPA: hypothetical protein [Caudoviricetes sp.]
MRGFAYCIRNMQSSDHNIWGCLHGLHCMDNQRPRACR